MQYEIHVTSKDMFGHDVVHNLLAMGKLGATVKEGTFPHMKFPYNVVLVLEAEEPPMPSAQVRVFDHKNKEIFANVLLDQLREKEKAAEKESGNFSVEQKEEEIDNSVALNPEGLPWTKEQLEDLPWNFFKKVVKTKGITGRDRLVMQRQYLEAVENSKKESESKTQESGSQQI